MYNKHDRRESRSRFSNIIRIFGGKEKGKFLRLRRLIGSGGTVPQLRKDTHTAGAGKEGLTTPVAPWSVQAMQLHQTALEQAVQRERQSEAAPKAHLEIFVSNAMRSEIPPVHALLCMCTVSCVARVVCSLCVVCSV